MSARETNLALVSYDTFPLLVTGVYFDCGSILVNDHPLLVTTRSLQFG